MTPGRAGRTGGGREWLECPGLVRWRAGLFGVRFAMGLLAAGVAGSAGRRLGFLHLEIEIEGHLRRFEILFLYAIMFRLL